MFGQPRSEGIEQARAMGMKTRSTFTEALKDAERYVGTEPKILALPKAFRTASVHLMMKDSEPHPDP